MISYLMIMLAFLNGLLIITGRVVNAKLGSHVSVAGASFWNHFVGFLFLALLTPFLAKSSGGDSGNIPFFLFLGGIIGTFYVTINSLVIPKVGATKATVLVIAGQIVLGTIIDFVNGKISSFNTTLLGIVFVIFGMWVGSYMKGRHQRS